MRGREDVRTADDHRVPMSLLPVVGMLLVVPAAATVVRGRQRRQDWSTTADRSRRLCHDRPVSPSDLHRPWSMAEVDIVPSLPGCG